MQGWLTDSSTEISFCRFLRLSSFDSEVFR